MELNALWRFFWHKKTWSSFIPTWTDHWKQMHRITTVKYPRMVNQKSSCSQLTNLCNPFLARKNVPRVRSSDFMGFTFGKDVLFQMSKEKNQLYTQSWSFLYPKGVLDSSSLSISKGFTQTKIEDICGSQSGFNRMSFHHLKFHLGFLLLKFGPEATKATSHHCYTFKKHLRRNESETIQLITW